MLTLRETDFIALKQETLSIAASKLDQSRGDIPPKYRQEGPTKVFGTTRSQK